MWLALACVLMHHHVCSKGQPAVKPQSIQGKAQKARMCIWVHKGLCCKAPRSSRTRVTKITLVITNNSSFCVGGRMRPALHVPCPPLYPVDLVLSRCVGLGVSAHVRIRAEDGALICTYRSQAKGNEEETPPYWGSQHNETFSTLGAMEPHPGPALVRINAPCSWLQRSLQADRSGKAAERHQSSCRLCSTHGPPPCRPGCS